MSAENVCNNRGRRRITSPRCVAHRSLSSTNCVVIPPHAVYARLMALAVASGHSRRGKHHQHDQAGLDGADYRVRSGGVRVVVSPACHLRAPG